MVTLLLMALHGLDSSWVRKTPRRWGPRHGADELNMGKGAYEIGAMFNFFLVAVLFPALRLDTAAQRALSRASPLAVLTVGVVYHIFTLIPGQAPLPQEASSASSRHGRSTSLSNKGPAPAD